MKLLISLLLFLLLGFSVQSQDIKYARYLIDTLSAPGMHGRGYVAEGDKIAASFLASEFAKAGLLSTVPGFKQGYTFPMNTLPGKLEAYANGRKLIAGYDYQVWPATPSIDGTFKVAELTSEILLNEKKLKKFFKKNFTETFIVIDKKGISDKKALALLDSLKYYNFVDAPGIIALSDTKLTGSVMIGYRPRNYALIDVRREALTETLKTFRFTVETEFVANHKASNIIGWVKGSVQSDTFLVFTAHFDHLGHMGKDVFYPGANDNASGTAMVTDLAKHYSKAENKPYYSMAFILLSGEEAGLLGSEYCAAHSPFDLKKIKFLINIDMVGTGSEGITMVNATKFRDEFDRMVKLNALYEYIAAVKERGESCNSDHCPFYKKGVPAVFIYSLGKEFTEYHNPDDKSSALPLTEYEDIFRLMRDFMDGFAK